MVLSSTYGLTSTGFVIMRADDIRTALNQAFTDAFGSTTNTANETVLGQIIGIMAEREALLWEALEDTVLSGTPSGAEGVYVDNLLALSGLTRLPASPTVTNPTPSSQADGRVLYGLVLYGASGTTIPQGTILQTSTQPTLDFTLDAAVTIGQPANALQRLFLSNTPSSGAFCLSIVAPSGKTSTSPSIAYNAQAQATVLSFAQPPRAGNYLLSVGQQASGLLSYAATAQDIQNAIQAIHGFESTGVAGNVQNGFVITWPTGANPPVSTASVRVSFSSTPTQGTFTLAFAGAQTSALGFGAAASDVQAAVNALPGYAGVGVTGNNQDGYTIHWSYIAPVSVTVATSSDMDAGVTASVTKTSSLDVTPTVANSVQAALNALLDPGTGALPYTDVAVTQPTSGQFSIAFGANSPATGQSSSGAAAQSLLTVATNTLASKGLATNLAVVNAVMGHPAQAVGSATCTSTGPNQVPAGALSVIGSAQSGFTGVTNQLDCLEGRNLETDAEAIARRAAMLQAAGSGPLASTVEQVLGVPGVTAALGFTNTTAAAQQRLYFATAPTSGAYMLSLGGGLSGPLAYNAMASDVQAALAAIEGYAPIQVTGSAQYGFILDFNGSLGGQPAPLVVVAQDTTGAQLTASYGRPPKSIELVVEGGDDTAIAQAILSSSSGGISTYGAPVLQSTGSPVAGSSLLSMASVANVTPGLAIFAQGLQAGTYVAGVSGNTVSLSLPALASASNVAVTVNHTLYLTDAAGNPQQVSFSRPQSTIIYVSVTITTDRYVVPGDAASGSNPASKFDPSSVAQIQQAIIELGNAVPIGGTLVAKGTNGLVGAFNSVAGVLDYDLRFDTANPPVNSDRMPLQPEQAPLFTSFTTEVSYI